MSQATEPVVTPETPPVPAPAETTPAPPAAEGATPEAKADEGTALTKPVDTAEIVYEIKAPKDVELDPAAISEFVEFAKAEKLPADLAQKVVDFGIKRQQALAQQSEKALSEQILRDEQAGFEELKKDPELGGANYEKTLRLAAEGFQKFATADERAFMDATRLGNRVPIIKLFARIALAMREEHPVGVGNNNDGAAAPKSEAALLREMYPNSPEMFGDAKE